MNNRQRREAIENYVCPNCGKQGAGFSYQEALICTWKYDPKKRRWTITESQCPDEVIGGSIEFEQQFAVCCDHCGNPVPVEEVENFGVFLEDIPMHWLNVGKERKKLQAELKGQQDVGLVHPGLRKRVMELEETPVVHPRFAEP
jgi:hypothetical protein